MRWFMRCCLVDWLIDEVVHEVVDEMLIGGLVDSRGG